MATCTQTVICQSGTLGCIICCKIRYYIVFIMNSIFLYIVLAILVIIYITPKHIRIWTILDILAVFAIFQFFMTWFTYEFLLSNFSISFLIIHWQQQVCSSYSQILHSYTMANRFYGNMCTHIHISLILLCFYCHELSFLSFHSDHLHQDEIICVLQLVQ